MLSPWTTVQEAVPFPGLTFSGTALSHPSHSPRTKSPAGAEGPTGGSAFGPNTTLLPPAGPDIWMPIPTQTPQHRHSPHSLCVSPILPSPEQGPASETAIWPSSSLVLWGGSPADGSSPLRWGMAESRVQFSLCPWHWADAAFHRHVALGRGWDSHARGQPGPWSLLTWACSNPIDSASVGKAGTAKSFEVSFKEITADVLL